MAALTVQANFLMVQFNHFYITAENMGYYFGGNSGCILDRREWQSIDLVLNWRTDGKSKVHIIVCVTSKSTTWKGKRKKWYCSGVSCLTALACNKLDPVELLVTQDRCSDMFTATRLNVPCFHQDSSRLAKAIRFTCIIFSKWSLFQLINITYLT